MIVRLLTLVVGIALAILGGCLVTPHPEPAFTPLEQQWQPPSTVTLVPDPPPPGRSAV